TGKVADVRPHLWSAAVAVAPLLAARGLQNKVLEAVAAGLPTVVTTQVHEGLPAEVRPACKLAADGQQFAATLIELLRKSPLQRRAIAEAADLQSLTWENRLKPLQ